MFVSLLASLLVLCSAYVGSPRACLQVKHVAPKAVIESGVAAGHGTWLLRELVGPDVPIFSLDPVGPDVQSAGARLGRLTSRNRMGLKMLAVD